MNTQPKTMPAFKTEDEERAFWATHSPLDYFAFSAAKRLLFPNLRPSLKSISIRLPEGMLDELKVLANKRDVPYQSLAKIYLSWGIKAEQRTFNTASLPNNRVERIAHQRRAVKRSPRAFVRERKETS